MILSNMRKKENRSFWVTDTLKSQCQNRTKQKMASGQDESAAAICAMSTSMSIS